MWKVSIIRTRHKCGRSVLPCNSRIVKLEAIFSVLLLRWLIYDGAGGAEKVERGRKSKNIHRKQWCLLEWTVNIHNKQILSVLGEVLKWALFFILHNCDHLSPASVDMGFFHVRLKYFEDILCLCLAISKLYILFGEISLFNRGKDTRHGALQSSAEFITIFQFPQYHQFIVLDSLKTNVI